MESNKGVCPYCSKSKIPRHHYGLGRKATACIKCSKAHDQACEDPRTQFIRSCIGYKERAVRAFLQEKFEGLSWTFNKRIAEGCSSRRPDAFVHLGSHVLTVEIDEYEHTDYDCGCEHRRTTELFEDAGRLPHVFVRFSPDEYYLFGQKVQGCWGRNPKTGEPRLAPKQRKQWEERLEKLAEIVELFRRNAPSKEVEAVFLFYSDR